MTDDSLGSYLPEAVDVTPEIIEDYVNRNRLGELTFSLYQEASGICVVCASAYVGGPDLKEALTLPQAICGGLLMRTAKFMTSVMRLASGPEHGEVIMALNRSISESVINMRFLIFKNSEDLYQRYVLSSLATEREFHDLVKGNIEKRGSALPIEENILESILYLVELSGTTIDKINPKFQDWAGGLRQRYEALGLSDRYVGEQRMGSHAVHGTWVDVALNHLSVVDGGFITEPEWSKSDGKLLGPSAYIALEGIYDYINHYFKEIAGYQNLIERIESLKKISLQSNWLEVIN